MRTPDKKQVPNIEDLRSKHRMILRMELLGYSNNQIAKEIGYTASAVSTIRSSPLYQAALSKLQMEADIAAREKAASMGVKKVLVDEALSSVQKLVSLREGAKEGAVQLKAATELLDRAGFGTKGQNTSPVINITISSQQEEDLEKVDEHFRQKD